MKKKELRGGKAFDDLMRGLATVPKREADAQTRRDAKRKKKRRKK